MNTRLVPITKRHLVNIYLLLGLCLLVGSACSKNLADELAGNPHVVLAEHDWLLSEVTFRGESKDITALHPTLFHFDMEKGLLSVTTPCEGADDLIWVTGYAIAFQDEQHYAFPPQDGSFIDCGERIEEQRKFLRVLDTSQYEIQSDQLFLIGDRIQIILDKDDTTP